MELIEDGQEHCTIKFDLKYDLNVIFAILTSAGDKHSIHTSKVASLASRLPIRRKNNA